MRLSAMPAWSNKTVLTAYLLAEGTAKCANKTYSSRRFDFALASRTLAQQEVERRAVEGLGILVKPSV